MADTSYDELIDKAGDRFNIAPEGTHEFTITDAEAKTFGSGNDGIKVTLKVAEGPHAGKSVKTVYVVKTIKAASIFIGHLAAVGITPDTLREQRPTLAQIAAVMVGKRVSGRVKHKVTEQYGTQAELQFDMKPPAGGATEVTEFPAVVEQPTPSSGGGAAPATGYADDPGF